MKNEDLINNGFCVVDDVLPNDLALSIYEIFDNNPNWDTIHQKRHNRYSEETVYQSTTFPQKNEVYSTKFNKSVFLEQNQIIKSAFKEHFIPLLEEYSPFKMNEYDYRCYKLDWGDHYRIHTDGYAGVVNLIYYVNKDWRWDWGGILNVLSNDDPNYCESIFPKFNRVVLLNNKTFSSPHFVSSVENWAINPRYSIVSFNK